MNASEQFVEEHKEEIRIEADRLHKLRAIFNPTSDIAYDNFVTAIGHIFRRYHKESVC